MYMLIKCGVLLLALLGFAMLYQRYRLPLCFFPAVTVSGIVILLYLAGLFGFLKPACYAVVLVGLLALLRFSSRDKLKAFFTDQSMWFLCFAMIWMYGITRGAMLSHYDEGSHWYRICKVLCYENAYPTTPDICFGEYVPGCAIWIYFVTRFMGFTIPNAMFAQNCLNAAAIAALYCAVPKEKGFLWKAFSFVLITAAGILLCSLTVSTYTLLVDAQIGLFALAALVLALEEGHTREALVPVSLILGFLALIKTSSLLFVGLILVWACIWSRFSKKEWIKCVCAWAAWPAALYSTYLIRSRLVYSSEMNAYQKVSLERYASLFGSKTAEEVAQIAKNFFSAVFLGGVEGAAAVYVAVLLFVLLYVCMKSDGEQQRIGELKRYWTGISVSAAVYILSLFATYLFSMRTDEALMLNSLYRYYGTGAILVVGMTIYAVLRMAERTKHSRMYMLSLLLLFVMLTPGSFSKRYILSADEYHLKEDFRSDIWKTMQIYIPENNLYSENSYAVLWNEDDFFGGSRDHYRMGCIAEAWLRSTDVVVVSEWELRSGIDEEKLQSLREYDYLACISDMSSYSELFSQVWGDTELTPGLREIRHIEHNAGG